MRNKIIAVCIFLLLLIKPSISRAEDPDSNYFDSFPLEIIQDGKTYIGILLSEDEYTEYTVLKQNYNLLKEDLQIFKDNDTKTANLLQESVDSTLMVLDGVKDIKKLAQKEESWWDRHKFEIGVSLGITATLLTVFAVSEIK